MATGEYFIKKKDSNSRFKVQAHAIWNLENFTNDYKLWPNATAREHQIRMENCRMANTRRYRNDSQSCDPPTWKVGELR